MYIPLILLYPDFSQIMSEYNDCLERCERLSEARQAYLLGTKNAVQLITTDDLLIYLRWFVWHQHSVKRFQQLARVSMRRTGFHTSVGGGFVPTPE